MRRNNFYIFLREYCERRIAYERKPVVQSKARDGWKYINPKILRGFCEAKIYNLVKFCKDFYFIFISVISISLAVLPAAVFANDLKFNVDPDYDLSGRTDVMATLVKTSPGIYFYIEKSWWDSRGYPKQGEILQNLDNLSLEFDVKIYPELTSVFGDEWRPGIDGDERISILFHQMKDGAGGYFRTADEYLRIQIPESNEKEMVYLTIDQVDKPILKELLGHEFVHLITFNQKDRARNVSEETWLNEARAEYAATILGYDDIYQGSNLERRVKAFLEKPNDSLTEWLGRKYDYGVVDVFTQYLAGNYGINTLSDSLKTDMVGISSINWALEKNGFKEDFQQIFTNWTVALFLNNCSFGKEFCYLNNNLRNFRLSPDINFLPLSASSSLCMTDIAKNWAGSWQKFIGGNGILKSRFESLAGLNFKIPYLTQDDKGFFSLRYLLLDQDQKGEFYISDFGSKNISLIIIPSLQTKISGFDGPDSTYPFTYTVFIKERSSDQEDAIIKELLARIEFLKNEIVKIQIQIDVALGKKNFSCAKILNNLSFGARGIEVSCLQEVLKSQKAEIYPEGLITGYFGRLTQAAVARFQEKYISEILTPLGLSKGTGFVGPATKNKINFLLAK